MVIFPPFFSDEDIIFDSISFKAGVYRIPESIYHLDKMKAFTQGKSVPCLACDWKPFTKPIPTMVPELEKEFVNYFENHRRIYKPHQTQAIMISNSEKPSYYFKNAIMIQNNSGVYDVYLIKEMVEKTLTNYGGVYDFKADSILYENGAYYALGERLFDFGEGAGMQQIYGKFKLEIESSLTESTRMCIQYKFNKEIALQMKRRPNPIKDKSGKVITYKELIGNFKKAHPEVRSCD
jgi:hypothetical protein